MEVNPGVIRRNIIIALVIILGMLAGVLVWVVPEALRVKRERDRRISDAAAGSDMLRIPPGAFTMGSNEGGPEEQPLHDVRVTEFWMDRREVTNAEFQRFVNATGYVTTAEKPPEAGPNTPANERLPGSWCFVPQSGATPENRKTWASWVAGANWKQPGGPGTSIDGRQKEPVVHVSFEDAQAYAKWAGKRLPTEAEWEYAARGGVILSKYPWGMEPTLNGRPMANGWEGEFPSKNLKIDGFDLVAPTGSFSPNNFGILDPTGNVAEWCADWYSDTYYAELRPNPDRAAHRNPPGPETSVDKTEPGVWKRVVRGGSFLSTESQLRIAARGREEPRFTAQWLGFRCVKDKK